MNPSSFNKIRQYKQFSTPLKTFLLAVILLFSIAGYAQKLEGTIRFHKTVQNIDDYFTILYLNATQTRYIGWDENDPEEQYRRTDTKIIRDYSKHTMHDIIEVLGKTYIIEDSLQAPRWLIKNEMKEIAGHVCMNALYNDTLRKQKVVAWYALDIPIGGGPERFFGLPGLILEVNINDGGMVITADKIVLKKLTTELDFPKKARGKKIKEKDYIEILRKHIAENRKNQRPLLDGLGQ